MQEHQEFGPRSPFDDGRLPGLPGGLLQLQKYFDLHGIPPAGRELIQKALTGPVRRVGGGRTHVAVRYASSKVDRSVQAESRTTELMFVELCEHDPDVVFCVCQPAEIHVRITDSRGRTSLRLHIPDYLVLDGGGFWFVECKPERKLMRDAAKENAKFIRDDSGWRWPAAEEAAAEFGVRYRVFSSAEVNSILIRNRRFLSRHVGAESPDAESMRAVTDRLQEAGTLPVHEALALPDVRPEVLWWLVANGVVFADLERELIFLVGESRVYASETKMIVGRTLNHSVDRADWSCGACVVSVEPDATLIWDGEPWTVLNRGKKTVTLGHKKRNERIVTLPNRDFMRLLQAGELRGDASQAEQELVRKGESLLFSANDKRLAEALRRHKLLEAADETGSVPEGVSPRSIRRYRKWARAGEREAGSRLAGQIRERGRRPGTSGLGSIQQKLLQKAVRWYFGDEDPEDDRKKGNRGKKIPRAGTMKSAHRRLVAKCAANGVFPPPSYETFRNRIGDLCREKLALRRGGARAAYQVSGPLPMEDNSVPAVPDRVLQTAHIDHVFLDVLLVSEATGAVLGTPVLTLMIDEPSRMPLAWSLSFDEPSRLALSEVVFDCASRHSCVPESIVVDQGPEFNSVDFEAALAWLKVHKVERPATEPRFGLVIERMFGIANSQFVHELVGNTRLLSHGRNLSFTHHPARHAALTLSILYQRCEEYLFKVYATRKHGGLGTSPLAAFEHGLELSGPPQNRYVAADDRLRILLASTPSKRTRQVDLGHGIKIDYLWYWHPEFKRGDVVGTPVQVKLDPKDRGIVYAYVRGKWVVCRLSSRSADFAGRSWKQVRAAIQQLRAQRQAGAKLDLDDERVLGEFLLENDHQGDLATQIQRDRERQLLSSPQPEPASPPDLRLVKNGRPPDLVEAAEQEDETFPPLTSFWKLPDDDDGLEGVEPYEVR